MSFDISHLLQQWDYQPGQAAVRRFTGRDGVEKIQLRLDLGVLQMNCEGRPDGKRPLGHASLYEYYLSKLDRHRAANGAENAFRLKSDDCAKLQFEALQYYQRHNCLWQLDDYAGVIRDTARNLAVCDFVQKYAETEELSWALQQFRPQLLVMHTRATATDSLRANDYTAAFRQIEEGMERLKEFHRQDPVEHCGEYLSLKTWLDELRSQRPLSEREKLERDLNDAVNSENYEKAAQVRDALRSLKPAE